ncbi:hypothetical protein BJ741DRAFT_660332 [Chytriomyces cf. hyalinus JEL632]|nr:hypothetical protein BJ741DRAFT_660332 [Chytriomyces cf. hyalinus JEL632]
MSSIILAGCEQDKTFEKAEALAYHLAANLADYTIEINTIPPEEWDSYKKSVYEENEWALRRARDRKIKKVDELDQLIWRESGELIGNTRDYIELMKHAYGEEVVKVGLFRVQDD